MSVQLSKLKWCCTKILLNDLIYMLTPICDF